MSRNSEADMDAAWLAFQSFPIDHAEDSDEQQRKAVEAAVRAALSASSKESAEEVHWLRAAVVRVHKTGGNPGIAWSASPVDDAPLMRDGEILYAMCINKEPTCSDGLRQVRELAEIQAREAGTGDIYMVGLFNGLELALATMENREPKFVRTSGACSDGGKTEVAAWMRKDGAKAMPADEKEAWIEAGQAEIAEDYTIPLYRASGYLELVYGDQQWSSCPAVQGASCASRKECAGGCVRTRASGVHGDGRG